MMSWVFIMQSGLLQGKRGSTSLRELSGVLAGSGVQPAINMMRQMMVFIHPLYGVWTLFSPLIVGI
jgi:hypothetical protein